MHELGHILGLGHPDQDGQRVRSIMNSHLRCNLGSEPFRYCDTVQQDDINGVYALHPTGIAATGYLGNPRNNSYQSGIGVISGWTCDADYIEIHIRRKLQDNSYIPIDSQNITYGTKRPDTEAICGDIDNGFGLLINWSEYGEGEYRIIAYVDGTEELGGARITVTTLGTNFLRGVTGQFTLSNFPYPGESVVVEWEQSLQNFVIKDHRE